MWYLDVCKGGECAMAWFAFDPTDDLIWPFLKPDARMQPWSAAKRISQNPSSPVHELDNEEATNWLSNVPSPTNGELHWTKSIRTAFVSTLLSFKQSLVNRYCNQLSVCAICKFPIKGCPFRNTKSRGLQKVGMTSWVWPQWEQLYVSRGLCKYVAILQLLQNLVDRFILKHTQ